MAVSVLLDRSGRWMIQALQSLQRSTLLVAFLSTQTEATVVSVRLGLDGHLATQLSITSTKVLRPIENSGWGGAHRGWSIVSVDAVREHGPAGRWFSTASHSNTVGNQQIEVVRCPSNINVTGSALAMEREFR